MPRQRWTDIQFYCPSLLSAIVCGIVAIGVSLRIEQYFLRQSLLLDEAFLALNVIGKSPAGLTGALDFNQAAPTGFLELEKLATTSLSSDEYGLRLVPFTASVMCLVFSYPIFRRLIHQHAAVVALLVFSLMDPLIFYGATAKPYSLDVGALLLTYGVSSTRIAFRIGKMDALKLGGFGAVMLWFSYASAFALAGLAATLAARHILAKRWTSVKFAAFAVSMWCGSFILEFHLSRGNLARIQSSFNHGSGVLLAKASGHNTTSLGMTLDHVRYFVGLEDTASGWPALKFLPHGGQQGMVLLLVTISAVGLVSLMLKQPWTAVLVVVTLALTLLASFFHKYPLAGRTLLFLLPLVALCIGEGLKVLCATRTRSGRTAGAVVAAVCIASVGLLPFSHLVQPRTNEDVRPALEYLAPRFRVGDALFVGTRAQYGLAYYQLCRCSAFNARAAGSFVVVGGRGQLAPAIRAKSDTLVVQPSRNGREASLTDIRPLIGRRRVWILLDQVQLEEKRSFFLRLGLLGRDLQGYSSKGASGAAATVRLYDLTNQQPR